MKIVYASVDFVLLNTIISLHGGISLNDLVWYSICIGLGFGLRVAVLVKDNKYTHRTLFIHMVFTICWCFLMVLLWRTWLNTTWMNKGGNSFEIYLFLNSLFSVYMVGQFEHFFKLGVNGWLRMAAGKILAKEIEEEKP